ncbi:MAG TPA: hypothetical protein VKU94_03785 [Geobacterales bacterium]|nr:hypothetical protein [Geobacterales bacterium]
MPYLKINQIQEGMINVSLIARVLENESLQEGKFKLLLEDGTGKVSLLSRERYTVGTTLKIERAYAYKFRGQLSISVMKKGKVSVIE